MGLILDRFTQNLCGNRLWLFCLSQTTWKSRLIMRYNFADEVEIGFVQFPGQRWNFVSFILYSYKDHVIITTHLIIIIWAMFINKWKTIFSILPSCESFYSHFVYLTTHMKILISGGKGKIAWGWRVTFCIHIFILLVITPAVM